jgi:hypothetical protein
VRLSFSLRPLRLFLAVFAGKGFYPHTPTPKSKPQSSQRFLKVRENTKGNLSFSLRPLRLFLALFAVKGFSPHANPKILNRKVRKGFAKFAKTPKAIYRWKLCV